MSPLRLVAAVLVTTVCCLWPGEPARGVSPATATTGASPSARWRWPLDGTAVVVRAFEAPPDPYAAGHRGVDLAAGTGALVRAAGAGTLEFAGQVAGVGVVVVDHGGGWRTSYLPVLAHGSVGDPVNEGSVIGVLAGAHPGCPTACLHWGLRHGDVYHDPLELVGRGRVRLLPLGPAQSSSGTVAARAGLVTQSSSAAARSGRRPGVAARLSAAALLAALAGTASAAARRVGATGQPP